MTPAQLERIQNLRRSSAAGTHGAPPKRKTSYGRSNRERQALRHQD